MQYTLRSVSLASEIFKHLSFVLIMALVHIRVSDKFSRVMSLVALISAVAVQSEGVSFIKHIAAAQPPGASI